MAKKTCDVVGCVRPPRHTKWNTESGKGHSPVRKQGEPTRKCNGTAVRLCNNHKEQ